MNKISPINNDEIDLIALFKIIWDGKMKILLITIISFFVGFAHNSKIPVNYLNSLTIKPSKNNEFIELNNIQKLLNSSQLNQFNQSNQLNQFNQPNQFNQSNQSNQSKQLNQLNLGRFINELLDYEEFLTIIKNTKKVQEHFSNLNIKDQEKKLFKYAKSLEIVPPKINDENYIIMFEWNDPEEAKKILQDTFDLVSKNLKERKDSELEQILEFEKKLLINQDKIRLEYLKEQSAIARELNITDNQIESANLSQSTVSLNVNISDIAYYLRGYKAINKEIELIENREYQNLKFLRQEINSFKALSVKFADYNVYLMSSKLLKDTELSLVMLIIFGLIVGIFYVLISNAFQARKNS
jgi:LPS O-antigen subunit length determinant protein (WzzB/FepE family)